MSFDGLKIAFDNASVPDPYEAFRATAEQCAAQTVGAGYESSFPPATIEALSQSMTPSPISSLAAGTQPGPANETAPAMENATKPGQGSKFDQFMNTEIQAPSGPGGEKSSVRTTDELGKQARLAEAAKKEVTGQGLENKGPQKDILGNNVNPSLAGSLVKDTFKDGVFVGIASAAFGPVGAKAAMAVTGAKQVLQIASVFNGPLTAEQGIVMDSPYKASPVKGFGDGKRSMRGYDYASSSSRGTSLDQQAKIASVSGGGSIRVDPAFGAQYAHESLNGMGKGMKLNPEDVEGFNRQVEKLGDSVAAQKAFLDRPLQNDGMKGLVEGRDNGVNLAAGGDKPTYGQLVPKDHPVMTFRAEELRLG